MASTTKTIEATVSSSFQEIERSLKQLKAKNSLTTSAVKAVLSEKLLPNINTRYFTFKVLGKNLTKVPGELKPEFIEELSIQLINSYSTLLVKYDNETLTIGQASLSKSGKIAVVPIELNGQGKRYRASVSLIFEHDSWQFFDITVEGISLLQTKQQEINSSFSKVGVDATLAQLKIANSKIN